MAKKVPVAQLPIDDGSLLWEVHFKSSYYDNDARMPGTVPVDQRFFLLAKNRAAALKKAEPLLEECRKQWKNGEVSANVATLENLAAVRDSSGDGRMGWISVGKWSEVKLSLKEDQKRYRLGVCLIPIEE